MGEMAVKLKGRPTKFLRFVLDWWVLGLMLVPFFRMMPVSWLVHIETEVVNDG
ncbi:hypothetical protein [Agrobacterium tumefaciens]|uniref:hypothetical protein n=1 Tax=Agrobacterium tumefaciens TaxID=358 RepID=UPI0021D3E367|nr:hypothetical protein [Agrobacterium tumefaciens]UXT27221.1 hypothetical protein FY139_16695 [Agrobacterium tumefaciens]UXT33169.1 hypothetical protein FY138_07020 [Agrobacterium tumefaciens]